MSDDMNEDEDEGTGLMELATNLGMQILDGTKTALKGEWDSLTDEDKNQVKRATTQLAKLEAKHRLLGEEPDPERVKVLKATIRNWVVVGEIKVAKVQSAFLEGLKAAASVAGSFLAGFAKSMVPFL